MLRSGEELRSCGVKDGSAVQVASRVRGGGKHKDKKSKAEKKQAAGPKKSEFLQGPQGPKDTAETVSHECNQDEVFQMIEANGEFQKMIMEGSVVEVEERIRNYLAEFQDWLGWDEELMEEFGERVRGVVVEKRREKVPIKAEQEQGKEVRFREEEQSEEIREQSTDGRDVTSGLGEVRAGRGSAGPVRGGDERRRTNKT